MPPAVHMMASLGSGWRRGSITEPLVLCKRRLARLLVIQAHDIDLRLSLAPARRSAQQNCDLSSGIIEDDWRGRFGRVHARLPDAGSVHLCKKFVPGRIARRVSCGSGYHDGSSRGGSEFQHLCIL